MTSNAPPKGRILWFNVLFVVVFPVVAIAAAAWYQINYGITWREIVASVICWWLTGIGICAGYHRLFSHKGYKARPVVRLVLSWLGAAASQNSAIAWCSDHRYHHLHTDTHSDPYNAQRGFWYSHIGWILFEGSHGTAYDNVPDLKRDPILAFQHKHWFAIAWGVNLLMLTACSLVLGNWLGIFIIAGPFRVVVVQHFTFLVNSIAHMWGSQPYSQATSARDNWALSFLTMGEGYHNYHHSFEWDYRNGPRWYNVDPNKWLIWTLSKLGLTSGLRRTPMDVVLNTRFEEGRRGFLEQLSEWSDTKQSEWGEALKAKREQLAAAEASLEAELAALKAMRQSLSDRMGELKRTACEDLKARLEGEVQHLRRNFRQAQRAAKNALHGWEQLATDLAQSLQLETVPSAA